MDSGKTQIDRNDLMRNNSEGGMYGPSVNSANIKRTYIAGLKPNGEVSSSAQDENTSKKEDRRIVEIHLQERPLAGVLYSVSGGNLGEIFPVYAGRNTIGGAPESDIYLSECSVSSNHAVLLVRILSENGTPVVKMSITDYDSEYGTYVCGNRMGFDKEPLYGNELIQIGGAYQFLFVPLNPFANGMAPSTAFSPVPRKDTTGIRRLSEDSYAPYVDTTVYPSAVGEEYERTFYGRTLAKKEDHSAKKTIHG